MPRTQSDHRRQRRVLYHADTFYRTHPPVSSSLSRHLQQAEKHLHQGDAIAAQAVCEQVLRKAPRNPDALFLLGIAHLSQNRPADGVTALERAIAADPRHGAALEHLGLAHLMLGRYAAAEQVLQRATALPRAPASVFMRLGIAILEQHRADQALPALRRAVSLDATDPDCHINLGRALALTGDASGAADCFQAAMRVAPQRPEPAFNLGVLAMQADDPGQAQRWFERALAQAPAYIDAMLNLAIVLQRQSEFARASGLLEQAMTLDPRNPALSNELARTLALQGRHDAAYAMYRRTLESDAVFAPAYEGLAAACLATGRAQEAVAHLRRTLELEPHNVPAAAALASALFEIGDLDGARAQAERVVRSNPEHAMSHATLANTLLVRGDIESAIAALEQGYAKTHASTLLGMLAYQLRQACDWKKWAAAWQTMTPLLESEAPLGSPFWLLCEPTTAAQQLAYTRRWAAARFAGIAALPLAPSIRAPDRRIRIGYLSSDLHDHATAYLMAEVFERHDREHFEIFAYSHGPDDHSAMLQRLRNACEHFIDIAREPDDVAAARIRDDALDVLVDLKGYTLGDRVTLLARRPCAIQATWLGYPGTTGASFMDYLIADPVVVPQAAEQHYSETVLRLPHCYQPNDRARAVAEPHAREAYGLPSSGFVFACFNQTYKITPDVFAAWMRLLDAVPDSVLWLFDSNDVAKRNLLQAAREHGMDDRRVIFAPRLPNAEHLARYRVADLALDTFPYTSHTTMSDALWCGCPGIALCGDTFASRVSASLLTAAGLPDLVTHSLPQYESLALKLARSPQALQEMRAQVDAARDHSPLFDSTGFTRELETLYMAMLNARTAATGERTLA